MRLMLLCASALCSCMHVSYFFQNPENTSKQIKANFRLASDESFVDYLAFSYTQLYFSFGFKVLGDKLICFYPTLRRLLYEKHVLTSYVFSIKFIGNGLLYVHNLC